MKLEDYSPDDDLINKCMETVSRNSEAYISFYIEDGKVKLRSYATPDMEVILRVAMFDYLSGPIEE